MSLVPGTAGRDPRFELRDRAPIPLTTPRREPWFLYVVRCADGTLYTGIARNVAARLSQHEAGRGARYTRGRGPVALCAVRRCADQGRALRLEYAVKQLTRADKEALLRDGGLAVFARKALRRRSAPAARVDRGS